MTWSGTVAGINFALHGEPNGVILDSGEFVHLKPPAAKQAGLSLGDAVSVTGSSFRSDADFIVIEPEMLNGTKIDELKRKKKGK